jgi:hypothetical protein
MSRVTFTAQTTRGPMGVVGEEIQFGFVLHVDINGTGGMMISDPVCGASIASGKTKAAALAELAALVKQQGGLQEFSGKLEIRRKKHIAIHEAISAAVATLKPHINERNMHWVIQALIEQTVPNATVLRAHVPAPAKPKAH